jgi:hypothetical protein
MSDKQRCVDCSRESPETNTNYTLISAQYGWRLQRTRRADGVVVVEWRCPECWRRYKEARPTKAAFGVRSIETPLMAFARARRRLAGRPSDPPPSAE